MTAIALLAAMLLPPAPLTHAAVHEWQAVQSAWTTAKAGRRHVWQRQRACPHATHFAVVGSRPWWGKHMRKVCVIGDHAFYAERGR